MDYNILSWLIWLPVIGVAAIAFIPRDKVDLIKTVSAVVTGLQFLLTLVLWNNFDSSIAVSYTHLTLPTIYSV